MTKIGAALLACALPVAVAAQEPIFVTPPVTMYEFGGVVGADVGGTAALGLAPGLLVHSKHKVFKLGVFVPVGQRQTDADPTVKAAVKVLC